MTTQSSHAAQRANAGEHGDESNSSRPAAPHGAPVHPLDAPVVAPSQFRWTMRDVSDAGLIAFTLGVFRKVEHGESVIGASCDLQAGRRPRLTDAYVFFHAHTLLRDAKNTVLAAAAHRLGARIALHVTGWTVTDMVLAECGASAALGLYVEGSDFPMVLEKKTADGRTVLELRDDELGSVPVNRLAECTPGVERAAIIAADHDATGVK